MLLLVIAASLSSNGQRNHYKMSSSVHCLKTTESGEDEIYIIIAWKTSYGQKGYKRVPATSDHFDIDDDERFLNTTIYTDIIDFDLAPNENKEIFYSLYGARRWNNSSIQCW
jgi:hypothetical protein